MRVWRLRWIAPALFLGCGCVARAGTRDVAAENGERTPPAAPATDLRLDQPAALLAPDSRLAGLQTRPGSFFSTAMPGSGETGFFFAKVGTARSPRPPVGNDYEQRLRIVAQSVGAEPRSPLVIPQPTAVWSGLTGFATIGLLSALRRGRRARWPV